MKKLTILLLLLSSLTSFGQLVTYEEFKKAKKPKSVKLDAYKAENGQVFKIGDKITLSQPNTKSDTYLYIARNDLGTLKPIGIGNKGFKAEIKKFRIYGRKRTGYNVVAVTKTPDGLSHFWISIEDAIKNGEIETTGLNREQAIAKLKESKELFDLGMISKEEYEKIKKELTPIIMKKK